MTRYEKKLQWKRKAYKKTREAHLCIRCKCQDDATLSGRAYCKACGDTIAAKRTELKETRRAADQCTTCGAALSLGDKENGMVTCARCRRYARIRRYGVAIPANPTPEQLAEGKAQLDAIHQEHNAKERDKKHRRVANHQCAKCGKQDNRTLQGMYLCVNCATYMSNYNKQKRREKRTM